MFRWFAATFNGGTFLRAQHRAIEGQIVRCDFVGIVRRRFRMAETSSLVLPLGQASPLMQNSRQSPASVRR